MVKKTKKPQSKSVKKKTPKKAAKRKTPIKMGRGRKSKLTKELIAKLASHIKDGMPYKYAAELSGISEATFFNYLSAAEKACAEINDESILTEEEGLYFEFLECIKKAEAEAIEKKMKLMHRHASKKWQAAAWFLERRDPDNFGRKDKVSITHFTDGDLQDADKKISEVLDRGED